MSGTLGGVVSDWMDSVGEWFNELIKDGVKSQFDSMSELLTDTFDTTTGTNGLLNMYVNSHPAEFTGNVGGTGEKIWTTIETLCNNVVVPVGGFILMIILLTDLFQMVIRGNNFKDFDNSIFFKWIIKALCGVLLVSNVFYIASGLFSFGTNVCANGLSTLFGVGSYLQDDLAIQDTALDTLSTGTLMSVWIISLFVHLAVMLIIVIIIVTLASRIIEIFMYLGAAPIPIATLMYDGEWSSVGKNWIKQLLALSFQGFFIVVALAIFKTLFANMITSINTGVDDGIMMQMAMLLGYTAALIFTLLRTSAISKSVFNAH